MSIQPAGTGYTVKVHSIWSKQGFHGSFPCGLSESYELLCYACYYDKNPVRTVRMQRVMDLSDHEVKILKLPVVGARALLEFYRDEDVLQLETSIRITRTGERKA